MGGREGWIKARDLLYICARICGINLMMPAQEKKQKSTSVSILFNTQLFPPPYTAHNVCLSQRIKLAGWVWMLPHAVQFEK